ncbi:MAG: hypothetical protein ACHQ51_12560 [Elusimicrobiota bacterium]
MASRLRAALATFLAASLVLVSPGLEAPRLFAQVIGRAVPAEGVRALPGMVGGAPSAAMAPSAAPAFLAPAMTAPSAFAAAPVPAAAAAAPALSPVARAASLPEMAKSLAPHLEAAAKPATSASGSAAAGRGIEDVLTGAKSAGAGEIADVAGAEGAGAPSLAPGAAAAAPDAPKAGVPAAAAPAQGKTVSSEISYRVHRFLLKTVAALTGAVNSLPAAGPALTDKLIASAADKRVVLSDFDDTLAAYNQVLPQDMVEAVEAVRAAGKDFAVISDRGDEKRAGSMTVFESLASLPVATRAGMYVAANSGGRVYRYDANGEPVRVYEIPALDGDAKAKVVEAAAATKAGLAAFGAEQHVPSAEKDVPGESWNTYGYALMLKVGSGKEQVLKAADLLQTELAKRGVVVEVSPRFAKDPANPPYINFSIVTKAPAAAFIAKALKAEAKDVVILGDSQYSPRAAKKDSWLARLGVTLSGREMPATGNQTDRNMEKALPGALTLSVGTTGDPRASNLWVLAGKGPSVTRRVLMSVASKTRANSRPKDDAGDSILAITGAVALVAAAGLAYYAMFSALGEVFRLGEQAFQQHAREVADWGMMFGGTLGLFRLRAKAGDDKAARYAALEARYVRELGAVSGVVSVKVKDGYHPYAANDNRVSGKDIEVVFDGVKSFQEQRAALPATLPAIDGVADVSRYNVVPVVARKAKAAAYAEIESGYKARFAATPGATGAAIKDSFNPYGPNDNRMTGKDIEISFAELSAYQEARASLPATLPAIDGVADVSRYNVVPVLESKAKAAAYAEIESAYKARLAKIFGVTEVVVNDSLNPYGPDDNRMSGKDIEVFFDGVTSLQAAREKNLLPKELPAIASLDDVAKYQVKASVAPAAGPLKGFLVWLGMASVTAGIYAALYYAASHAPAAVSSSPVPQFSVPQGWEGLFGGILGGAGLSRWLNRKKAPAVDGRFPTLKASVSPASPVDGFETYVYAEGLAAARAHAAELGYTPGNLRLTGARLWPRAWGEDWTFSFVVPREGYLKEPRAFELTVRRTMVSETQVDVFDLKDLGRSPIFVGFRAAALPAFVKVSPMDVVRRSGDDARTLELQARWTGKEGAPELWYVLRGDKGREVAVSNAETGAPDRTDRWAVAKGAAAFVGAAALAAALYAAMVYGFSHVGALPSAPLPEGWNGPLPDIGQIFGGTLGLMAAAGVVKKVRGAKAPKVPDERIASAAKSVVASKGGVWSQTEYNMGYYNTLERLKADGATEAQLAKFRELCDAAPVIGGRFNPWSGD